MTTDALFSTLVYKSSLVSRKSRLLTDVQQECHQIRDFDDEGREWSKEHYPAGFTSYASRNDLFYMSSTFRTLEEKIRPRAHIFAEDLGYDMKGLELSISDMWVNIMGPGCTHSGHIHPLSFISGTFYVEIPKGASAIRFEDPRLPFQMACPPKRQRVSKDKKNTVHYQPSPGTLILFESWLRHEVPPNPTKEERVSVSFNYHWGYKD